MADEGSKESVSITPRSKKANPPLRRWVLGEHGPMVPNADGAYTLGVQAAIFSQDDQNATETTLELVPPNKLTQNPTAGIPDIGSSGGPAPATPDQLN